MASVCCCRPLAQSSVTVCWLASGLLACEGDIMPFWSYVVEQLRPSAGQSLMQCKVCLSEVQDRNADLDAIQECQEHETRVLEEEKGAPDRCSSA